MDYDGDLPRRASLLAVEVISFYEAEMVWSYLPPLLMIGVPLDSDARFSRKGNLEFISSVCSRDEQLVLRTTLTRRK